MISTTTRSPSIRDAAQHSEVLDREHGNLGVDDRRREIPDGALAGVGRARARDRARTSVRALPSPGRPRMRAGEHLHLGEHRAERLGVDAGSRPPPRAG